MVVRGTCEYPGGDTPHEQVNDCRNWKPEHPTAPMTLEQELRSLINRRSMETRSNTPDYVLASYLSSCLITFEHAIMCRDAFGRTVPAPVAPVKYKVVDEYGENKLAYVEGLSILQRPRSVKEITLFATRREAQEAIDRTEQYAREHRLVGVKAWTTHRIVEVKQ